MEGTDPCLSFIRREDFLLRPSRSYYPPEIWNGQDWKALVELRPPYIWKIYIWKYIFERKKCYPLKEDCIYYIYIFFSCKKTIFLKLKKNSYKNVIFLDLFTLLEICGFFDLFFDNFWIFFSWIFFCWSFWDFFKDFFRSFRFFF